MIDLRDYVAKALEDVVQGVGDAQMNTVHSSDAQIAPHDGGRQPIRELSFRIEIAVSESSEKSGEGGGSFSLGVVSAKIGLGKKRGSSSESGSEGRSTLEFSVPVTLPSTGRTRAIREATKPGKGPMER